MPVDDGSDVLTLTCFTVDCPATPTKRKRGESSPPERQVGWRSTDLLPLLSVVRVRGRVKLEASTGTRTLAAESITACADRNDEARHAIRCAELRRTTYSHPVGVAARELEHQRRARAGPVPPPPEVIVIDDSDSESTDTTVTLEATERSDTSSVDMTAAMASFESSTGAASYLRSPSRTDRPRRPRAPGQAEGSRLRNPLHLTADQLRNAGQLLEYLLSHMVRYDGVQSTRQFTFAALRSNDGLKLVATRMAQQAQRDQRSPEPPSSSQGLFVSQTSSQGRTTDDLASEPKPPSSAIDKLFKRTIRDLLDAGLIVLADVDVFGAGDEAYQLVTPALIEPEYRLRGRRALERDERWARAVVQAIRREPERYAFMI